MRIALITDTHWGARNDSHIFLDSMEKFYNDIFFPKLAKENIDTIIHLGDIVDKRKQINFVTLNRFRSCFVDRCVDMNIKLHVIIGNHDIPYRNNNKINAMSELFGSYINNGVSYYDSPEDVVFDGLTISIMPWINPTNYPDCVDFINNTNSRVLMGHLDLNGFEMYRGLVNTEGMDCKLFKRFELVCSGHFHHKSKQDNIQYLGNPFQLTWNDYNDQRGFHIFDTETIELTFVPNPYIMFYKIFYDDSEKTNIADVVDLDFSLYENTYVKVIVQNKTNPYWFDKMLDNLYKANPANVSIVDDNKNLSALSDDDITNDAEDTITIMKKYVDNIELNVDSNKLHQLLNSLYNEAQQLES